MCVCVYMRLLKTTRPNQEEDGFMSFIMVLHYINLMQKKLKLIEYKRIMLVYLCPTGLNICLIGFCISDCNSKYVWMKSHVIELYIFNRLYKKKAADFSEELLSNKKFQIF